jgi:thiol-disulfide isomerase/thioredoxin
MGLRFTPAILPGAGPVRHTVARARQAVPVRVRMNRRRRRLAMVGMTVVLAAVVVVLVVALTGGDDSSPPPRPTAEAIAASDTSSAAWDLPALDGPGRVALAQFRGRPTVVHFFSSDCAVCDDELPLFRSAVSAYGDRVDFVFVDTADAGDWRPMVERHHLAGLPLAGDVAADRSGVGDGLYRAVGGTGTLPLTAFYEADGSLVQVAERPLLGGTLRQALQQVYGIGA